MPKHIQTLQSVWGACQGSKFHKHSQSVRSRIEAVIKDRNASQKHAWRAAIILLSANSVGTNDIMRRTGKSKTCVWRWQERFMEEGADGLLREKPHRSQVIEERHVKSESVGVPSCPCSPGRALTRPSLPCLLSPLLTTPPFKCGADPTCDPIRGGGCHQRRHDDNCNDYGVAIIRTSTLSHCSQRPPRAIGTGRCADHQMHGPPYAEPAQPRAEDYNRPSSHIDRLA